MEHELKILPKYYNEILIGKKTFELRKNDRDFKEGDTLKLREFDGTVYTNNFIVVTIQYVLKDCSRYGLMNGYAILGI